MTLPTTLRFGGTTVEVWSDCTRVTLPSGGTVVGAPQDNDAYRAAALRLGYGADTAAMSREHEVGHAALCHFLGLPCSPVMSTVAGEPVGDVVTHWLEEEAVMAVQRLARAVGVDLVEVWKRTDA